MQAGDSIAAGVPADEASQESERCQGAASAWLHLPYLQVSIYLVMMTVAPCLHTLYCDYAQQAQCIFNDAQVQLQLDYIYCIYRSVRHPLS